MVFDCTRWNANPDDGLNEVCIALFRDYIHLTYYAVVCLHTIQRELWLERPVGRVLGMP